MNSPSDSSSRADSDSGFDFVAPPSAKKSAREKSLQAPQPAKSSLATVTPKTRAAGHGFDIETIDTGREFPQTVADRLHRQRSQLSSFFTSTILHLVVLIVLALWAVPRNSAQPEIGLRARLESAEVVDAAQSPIKIEMPEVANSPIENVAEDTSTDIEEMAASEVPTVVDSVPEKEALADAVEPTAMAPLKTLPSGGGLEGRDADSRARLAAANGGSAGSEAAVELGLRWIVNHQLTDGSWRFRHHRSDCDGRCGNEGSVDAPAAATGLALMSLLGGGYTHRDGPYQGEVEMGLLFLKREIRYLPYGGSLGRNAPQPMYAHAIATIALAEALAMTDDPSLRKPVAEAYRYMVTAQHPRGGWKYTPQKPGDMSVTGWMVMAMKACENAGVEPNLKSKKLAKEFVDSLAFADGVRYGYEKTGGGDIKPADENRKPSCTAIGNLLQMYLGRELEHPALQGACQYLSDAGSSDSDIYYDYYGTLLLHQARAPQWKQWNQTVRDHLIRTQQKHGHEAGSWFFPDLHGNIGGRLYTTAMAVMTLEVYYRFMPLYKMGDDYVVEVDEPTATR